MAKPNDNDIEFSASVSTGAKDAQDKAPTSYILMAILVLVIVLLLVLSIGWSLIYYRRRSITGRKSKENKKHKGSTNSKKGSQGEDSPVRKRTASETRMVANRDMQENSKFRREQDGDLSKLTRDSPRKEESKERTESNRRRKSDEQKHLQRRKEEPRSEKDDRTDSEPSEKYTSDAHRSSRRDRSSGSEEKDRPRRKRKRKRRRRLKRRETILDDSYIASPETLKNAQKATELTQHMRTLLDDKRNDSEAKARALICLQDALSEQSTTSQKKPDTNEDLNGTKERSHGEEREPRKQLDIHQEPIVLQDDANTIKEPDSPPDQNTDKEKGSGQERDSVKVVDFVRSRRRRSKSSRKRRNRSKDKPKSQRTVDDLDDGIPLISRGSSEESPTEQTHEELEPHRPTEASL